MKVIDVRLQKLKAKIIHEQNLQNLKDHSNLKDCNKFKGRKKKLNINFRTRLIWKRKEAKQLSKRIQK
jgi:hypothetical protein